jgi:phospholipase A1/A2
MRIITVLLMLALSFTSFAAGPETAVTIEEKTTPESAGHEAVSRDAEPETRQKASTIDEIFYLYQPYQVNFAAYEPVYFLVGTNPEESKFQISFKYQVFKDENYLAVNHPWVKGFNLGYTQTSFWDLKTISAPFDDTSYKPEVFYVSPNIKIMPDWVRGFLFQAGVRHESNGRGDEYSRSTNSVYIRPIFVYYRENSRYGLLLAPRFRAYFKNDRNTNPDLPDYRGYFDLDIKLGKADSLIIGANIALAKKGTSFQTDLTYPLNRYIFKDLNLFLQVQYVDAPAENLIDYQKRNHILRIGFALIR